MIGVDTNVLVRLLTQDDADQNARARAFFAERNARDPAYVSAIVLAKALWLLRKRMMYPPEVVELALRGMLSSNDIRLEHAERLGELLDTPGSKQVELTDCLVAWSAAEAGCSHTVTFDRRAATAVQGMELIP
ncbi:MAG: PIN domain-containing protein [Mesorhizobium sp.]|jgi:predicted nucleic-acid-binding protein